MPLFKMSEEILKDIMVFQELTTNVRLFQAHKVNITAAEALAPCVCRTSAEMILIRWDK